MKYRIVKDDSHPHADYHTYKLVKLKTNIKGKNIGFDVILNAESFTDLIVVVDQIVDSFDYDTLSLTDLAKEIDLNLRKQDETQR